MMILTYIKIGAAVVLLGVCSFYVWSYQHMKGQIVTLQTEIEGLKLRAEVIEKAQAATDKFMQAKTKVVKKNVQQRAEVDAVVESGDSSGMRNLWINRGMLKSAETGVAGGGVKSNTKYPLGRPPKLPGTN